MTVAIPHTPFRSLSLTEVTVFLLIDLMRVSNKKPDQYPEAHV